MIDLKDYGYKGKQYKQNDPLIPARVIEPHRDRYKLICPFGGVNARLKTSIFHSEALLESFPTVGDFVMIEYNQSGDSLIHQTLPRASFFSRRSPTPGRGEQAVAANFDYAFIMSSLNHDFNINKLQRYLTLAWQSGAMPVIVLTKADLVEDFSKEVEKVQEIAIGIEVIAISAVSGIGIDKLTKYLVPTKTLVLLGSSGIGKSSLVNALANEEIMDTKEIREDDSRGRHTTTHRQLITLKSGVMIIDTPGMRELGMWDISEGLGETFSDVEELSGLCKFSNCTHTSEPGCAILNAIKNGSLEKVRLKNYLLLKREARFVERKNKAMESKLKKKETPHKYSKNDRKFEVEE